MPARYVIPAPGVPNQKRGTSCHLGFADGAHEYCSSCDATYRHTTLSRVLPKKKGVSNYFFVINADYTDSDGIADVIDQDDDNDGIVDELDLQPLVFSIDFERFEDPEITAFGFIEDSYQLRLLLTFLL